MMLWCTSLRPNVDDARRRARSRGGAAEWRRAASMVVRMIGCDVRKPFYMGVGGGGGGRRRRRRRRAPRLPQKTFERFDFEPDLLFCGIL